MASNARPIPHYSQMKLVGFVYNDTFLNRELVMFETRIYKDNFNSTRNKKKQYFRTTRFKSNLKFANWEASAVEFHRCSMMSSHGGKSSSPP